MKKIVLATILVVSWCICYSQTEQDLDLAKQLRQELAMTTQDTSRVTILTNLCNFYREYNQDSSIIFGNQALALAQRINFPAGEANVLNELGLSFRILGNMPKSLELQFQGLQIAESNKWPLLMAKCLRGIGVVFLELKDYSKAISYFKRGKLINKTIHNIKEAASSEVFLDWNIGVCYMRKNQLDSSLFYLQNLYNKRLQAGFFSGPILLAYGQLQFRLGNHNEAIEYLHKSILINLKDSSNRSLSEDYNTIAGFYKEMNDRDSSIYFAKLGLDAARSISYTRAFFDASSLLAELYEPFDIKNAYYYLKIAKSANDELYGADKVQALQKIIFEDQEHQRKTETERVAYQNQAKQYALLAGLGVMFSIGFILYRNNKKKQKANKVLEETLTNLKSTQAQLIQSEKMASLGELTAGIAHEIQNPLNFVNNFSEVNKELIGEMKTEIAKGNLEEVKTIADDIESNEEKINHHGKRADAIVKGMLQHSRSSSGVKELTDINALCDEYLRLSYHGLRAKDKSFNADFKTAFDLTIGKINIIPQDIGRVLLNLYNNAFYAVTERRKLESMGLPAGQAGYEPLVLVSTKKINDKIEIRISDNGNGIPQNITDKIFQPFFSTKPTGQGTGLGLSISYDIIKAHGGEISVGSRGKVESKEGAGTTFFISLPQLMN